MDEPMDRRIARLALARFRVGGFVGTSIADLAGALGRLQGRHLLPLPIQGHPAAPPDRSPPGRHRRLHPGPDHPAASARTHRQLLDAYLAVLLAHREVVPLVATDVAVLNHPRIGPRLRAQNQQLRALLTAPDTSISALLRAEAALGAIWRPLIAQPPLDLTDPAHQHTLIDAAVATLQPSQSLPDGEPMAAAHIGRHAKHPHLTMPSNTRARASACRWTQRGEATMRRRDVTSVIAVGAAAAHRLAVRSWQLRWGATGEERAATLAGDDLIASRINRHEHAAASADPISVGPGRS